jgi:hypothetical protein
MNIATEPIGIMEAKTAVNASMHAIKQHMKWIDQQLHGKPTGQQCNTAWLTTLKIEEETANLKNMIDQLGAIMNIGRN